MARFLDARNSGIQYARAVACLCVLASHAAYFSAIVAGAPLSLFFSRDLAVFGVYLFFAISGYVIGSLALSGKNGGVGFLARRALRIYPAFWLTVTISAMLALVHIREPEPFDFVSLALLPTDHPRPTYGIPLWTLVYEVFFYCLVSILIALGASRRTMLAFCAGWSTVIVGASILVGHPYHHVTPGFYIAVSPTCFPFIFGLAAAAWEGWRRASSPALLIAAAVLWPLGIIAETTMSRFVVESSFGLSCALVLLAFTRISAHSKMMLSLGNASYGIYLLHFIVLEALFTHVAASLALGFWSGMLALIALCLPVVWLYGSAEYTLHRRLSAPQRDKHATSRDCRPTRRSP